MAVLKDSSDPHGKGLTAGVAPAETRATRLTLKASNPSRIDITAMRANRAIRRVSRHRMAAAGIRRIYQRLLDRAWADAARRGEHLPPAAQKDIPPTVPGPQ